MPAFCDLWAQTTRADVNKVQHSEDQRATEESTAERRCYMLGKKANKQAGASQQVAAGVCCTLMCASVTHGDVLQASCNRGQLSQMM